MLTTKTVRQILDVLSSFRQKYSRGDSIAVARQEAVREVSQRYAVTYQTIEDGCRRRLRLADIGELDILLRDWIAGEPSALIRQITANARASAHNMVATYFREPANSTTQSEVNPIVEDTTSIDFTASISQREARELRAIAEIKGIDEATLFRQIVSRGIRDELRGFAHAILNARE